MSDVKVEGYKVTALILLIQGEKELTRQRVNLQSSDILAALAQVFAGYSDAEKAAQLKKVRDSLISLFLFPSLIVSPLSLLS
jgi:hypothetical protein